MKQIPRLGFGTYGHQGVTGIGTIALALETGYRHLDTAQSYENEWEVGQALSQSGLRRDDVWVTTKIDTSNFAAGRLAPSLEVSAEKLATIPDLTLIHWPHPDRQLPLASYLDQLAAAKSKGLTRAIGVSNFPIALLQQAISMLGADEILTNQVELNPLFNNRKLAGFCAETNILVTCYLPIARGRLSGKTTMEAIALRLGASVEQVALAWELAKGYVTIPTSSRPERIRSNFVAGQLKLADDAIALIDGMEQSPRVINPDWDPQWD